MNHTHDIDCFDYYPDKHAEQLGCLEKYWFAVCEITGEKFYITPFGWQAINE